ncbi:MAG: Zn-dependent hydrolase [Bacteroidales bacterium]|nr:Zn-dependent hydrolase [Bacteroidales bacterium]
MKKNLITMTVLTAMLATSCNCKKNKECTYPENAKYFALIELKTDVSQFNEKEKQLLSYLFDAATLMDDVFWKQAYTGCKHKFLEQFKGNIEDQFFAKINYGPWERLNGNLPWVNDYDAKPTGANFYPADMTAEEFEALEDPDKTSLYTLIRRDENGKLIVVWYHDAYKEEFEKAAQLLEKAAELAEDVAFETYLKLRAKALRTSDYLESDMAWIDVKNSKFDIVIGPIENYEDALFGYKAATEAFVLIKDMEWSKKLEKYTAMLSDLQKSLPVPDKYKAEMPGTDSDISVFEAVFYQGDCNAGSKTIAINLPNDERVHISKGSRKLQLKNSMKAKFDKILLPITEVLMSPEQQKYITFDAFFENVTFHEVAHGMGIKNTVNGKGSVRHALKEFYAPLEEAKADIMSLFLVNELHNMGEMSEGDVYNNYVTFFAGIFRSSRFGAASAHGRANMLCLNYFADYGVFERNENGVYSVNVEKMQTAVRDLLAEILIIQGNGDYAAVKKWFDEKSTMSPVLKSDLDRVAAANIPKDIYFKQGKNVMGLK